MAEAKTAQVNVLSISVNLDCQLPSLLRKDIYFWLTMEEKEVETVAQSLSEWSWGQPCVILGGSVAKQLTLQL